MPQKINISIPTPCHENWEQMTIANRGRFCASCQKNVVDFTKASDRQIAQAFSKDSNQCGRFLESQLNRDLVLPKEKNRFWVAASAALIGFLGLGTGQLFAQTPVATTQNPAQARPQSRTFLLRPNDITGTVVNEYHQPAKGVKVRIKNSLVETVTDKDGKFTLKANPGDVIKFSGDNLKNDKVTVTTVTNYSVKLNFKKKPKMMMGRFF